VKIEWKVVLPILSLVVGALGSLGAAAITGNLDTEGQIKGKAADIIFAGDPTGTERAGRIALLAQLYPEQLRAFRSAGADFGVAASASTSGFLWSSADEKRLAFYQQAMTKVQCVDQVVELWRQLFGPNRVSDSGKTEWIETLTVSPCPSGTMPSPNPSAGP
jgi:hypothetical protein